MAPKHPNLIKFWRDQRGLTQKQLAKLIGTTNQQIGHLESGRRNLTQAWMVRVAPALQVLPVELIEPEKGVMLVEVSCIAGVWSHNPELPLERRYRVQVRKQATSGMAELHAYEVHGGHFNHKIGPGGTVFAAKVSPHHRLIAGKFYVLREKRNGEMRVSVRQCRLGSDGEYWLWFASTDPEYQTPVRRDAMSTLGIEIIGIVVAWTTYEEPLGEGEL